MTQQELRALEPGHRVRACQHGILGTLEGLVICWIRTRVARNEAVLVVLNHVVQLTPLAYSEYRARLLQAASEVLLTMMAVVLEVRLITLGI